MNTLFTNQNQEERVRSFLYDKILRNKKPIVIPKVSETLAAYMAYQINRFLKRSVILIATDERDAKKYMEELFFFTGDKSSQQIIYFPTYEVSPFNFEKLISHNATASKRIGSLYRFLRFNSNFIVVTNSNYLKEELIPRNVLNEYIELIMIGDKVNVGGLLDKLLCGGYRHNFMVKNPGDFSVKGGIIDFFPPMNSNPIRIEMFGNIIESIRIFSIVNQRSMERIEEVLILPIHEIIFDKNRINLIINKFRAMAIRQKLPREKVKKIIKNIKSRVAFSGIEKLISLIYGKMETLLDYLPSSIILNLDKSENFFDTTVMLKNGESLVEVTQKNIKKGNLFLIKSEFVSHYVSFLQIEKEKQALNNSKGGILKVFDYKNVSENFIYDTSFEIRSEILNGKEIIKLIEPLFKIIQRNMDSNYLTIVVCSSKNQIRHVDSFLVSRGIKTLILESIPSNVEIDIVCVCLGSIRGGFIFPKGLVSIITYEEIIKNKSSRRKFSRTKINFDVRNLEILKNGEFVVHAEHGIGKYNGLIKLDVNGVMSDFLLIIYKNNDRLYLPIDRMYLIQRYMGFEDNYLPSVNKIGGKTWTKLKTKARSSVGKIAEILLEIYAKRKIQVGYSFSCNEKLLNEFESRFIHEETTDQLRAIEDVLKDMKKNVPMDRLICGDVGCGKTEVALRASFVAVNEAKQVAVLVPTTVLAEQHYETFLSRFKQSAVKIACLSRFKSKSQQVKLIKEIKNGVIDIVVGTHRLLQKDVSFMDLGLVILDEEQRFGVKYKEKLKEMRASVDVLTLTATPIPRTLHLSLMGIRDTSVISTPPDRRRPIITYVCEFDYGVIIEAVRHEIRRKGQVFFIHNDIRTIQIIARKLKTCIPEVKLGIAHGQMNEKKLEKVMINFVEGKIDMLVCTTIIESGIDIGRANTIMVNRADMFGLSQIYQIRGRVGRSDEQAYAYLFVPEKGVIGDKASRRLRVLMEYSDLGSGFQIAMNDMKIRGCGTILGAFQSGHISAVGYYMFLKLMEEFIAQLKGESSEIPLETEINFFISAFIPKKYILNIDHRLLVYRNLAKVKNLKDISKIKDELLDRFGSMPEETSNLLFKFMLKILASRAGVKQIDVFNRKLTLYFNKTDQCSPLGIGAVIVSGRNRYKVSSKGVLVADLAFETSKGCLLKVREILIQIIRKSRY